MTDTTRNQLGNPEMSENVRGCPKNSVGGDIDCPTMRLSYRQRAALEMMLVGQPEGAIAEAVGVTRRTLYRWRIEEWTFRQALEKRRTELYGEAADRMSELLQAALDTLGRQVRDIYDPTSHRAARTLLSLARVGKLIADRSAAAQKPAASVAPPSSDQPATLTVPSNPLIYSLFVAKHKGPNPP